MNTVVMTRWVRFAPAALGLAALVALALWLGRGPDRTLVLRVPGTDTPPGVDTSARTNAVLVGKLIPGNGQPATNLPGAWPGFRGPKGDGLLADPKPLARAWDAAGPRELWSVDLGEGYAGPAVMNGRVYLMDYDREKKQDALRCLSLADGKEIWRFAYPVSVKRNHGMSRTVPAVTDKFVVAMGPKCNVACLDAVTGQLKWGMDLVRQFGTTVPPWYAGQCPLIDGDRVILAPGGTDVLMMAVELATGKILWQTPNTNAWKMTHSSIAAMDFGGQREFVYCANHGVVGVSAADGALLWQTTDWKISIATVPSPVILDGGRIFLSGGYDAGALMLQLKEGGKIVPQTLYRLNADTFGATQQTPVLVGGYLYGVRPDGRFVCLDPAGKIVWVSDPGTNFGLGPFLVAGDLIYAMNDSGKLTLLEASPTKYTPLASAQVLKGRESWAPMALVGGRLLARDITRMVCLDVGAR